MARIPIDPPYQPAFIGERFDRFRAEPTKEQSLPLQTSASQPVWHLFYHCLSTGTAGEKVCTFCTVIFRGSCTAQLGKLVPRFSHFRVRAALKIRSRRDPSGSTHPSGSISCTRGVESELTFGTLIRRKSAARGAADPINLTQTTIYHLRFVPTYQHVCTFCNLIHFFAFDFSAIKLSRDSAGWQKHGRQKNEGRSVISWRRRRADPHSFQPQVCTSCKVIFRSPPRSIGPRRRDRKNSDRYCHRRFTNHREPRLRKAPLTMDRHIQDGAQFGCAQSAHQPSYQWQYLRQ